MKHSSSPDQPVRPLLILGRVPEACDLAVRRVLHAKQNGQPLVVLDYQGSLSAMLTQRNKGNLHKSSLLWCDLGNRRKPAALFRFQRTAGMKVALRAFLDTCVRQFAVATSPQAIEAAVDLAYRLADQGSIGLAALARSLRRPELAKVFGHDPACAADLSRLTDLLDWALRFPAVYALSEGNNRVELDRSLQGGGTVWIEMPCSHFERLEHQLVSTMVEACVLDQLLSVGPSDSTKSQSRSSLSPLIVYGLPLATPVPVAYGLAGGGKHIGLFRFDSIFPLPAAAQPWLAAKADCWVAGEVGAVPAGAKSAWLADAHRARVGQLKPGEVWMRSGADGKAVTALVHPLEPPATLADGYRRQALKRLRLTPIKQFSTAAKIDDAPAPPNSDLYGRLCTEEALHSGWLRVKGHNRYSHGTDRVTIDQFGTTLAAQLAQLASELATGRYKTRPLRTVRIPKPDGEYRVLRIACVRDRVVQAAFLHLVEPLFDGAFSAASFAYRPGRNAHQAVAMARSAIRAGKTWVVTADIRRCFDAIDHEILLRLVGDVVGDRDMLRLLRHWLTADVIDLMDITPLELGVPQGEAISPLLANVYLDPLDKEFERNGIKFVRFADDYLVLCDTQPQAQAALRLMGEFLSGVLLLALKPAKTQYCHVDHGFTFLGFEFAGHHVAIPADKVTRATDVVHAHMKTMAAAGSAPEEKWRAAVKLNSLVRGFRNYFLIDDAPRIRSQLAQMDAVVETTAAQVLKCSSDLDVVWAGREKFINCVPTNENEASSLTGAYPQASRPNRLLAPPFEVSAQITEASAPAVIQASPAREKDNGGPATLVLDGRLHVMESGCYVTVSGQELVVRKKKAEVLRCPIGNLTTVYLEGKGIAVSAELTMRLCDTDVPVIFTPLIGVPSAIAQPVQTMRSNVRQQQVLRRDDPEIIRTGFRMLAAKVGNQASVLKYFARYRKRIDTDAYQELTRGADEVRGIAETLDGLDPAAIAARALGMGHEGRAAAKYWTSLARLVPVGLSFPGRHTRHATDPLNSAINYVYGILYGEVWRAVVRAGLDPYFGIMHGSVRDQGSLVFDLIEEYRAPFGDRVVISMLGRGFDLELDKEGRLRSVCRRKLVSAFHKQWRRAVRWRGRMRPPADILEAQVTSLKNSYLGKEEYRPFRFRW